jgi:hypothetical protein
MDLPEAQRAALEALTRQDGYDGSVSARAQMVLWRADGFSVGDIVRMSDASKPTVYKWLDRYERLGVDGLGIWRVRGGRRKCLTVFDLGLLR